jgi:hypothetical protein
MHVASETQQGIQASTVFNRSFNHALTVHGNRNVPYRRVTPSSNLLGSREKGLFSSPRDGH